MSNTLEWFFSLQDRISGPANKARAAVDRLAAGIRTANRALSDADRAAGRFLDGAGKIREAGGQFAAGMNDTGAGGGMLANLSRAATVATALLATARAIGSAFADGASAAGRFAVQQAVFNQGTMTSLRATLHGDARGGDAAARAEFSRSLQLASVLPGDNNEFVNSRRQLAAVFSNAGERDAVFALQEDLASLNPENASGVRASLTNVLSQIRGQDRVLGNDLIQLQSAGLGRLELFDALARMRNLQGNEASRRSQARSLISSGAVHGDEAIRAMIAAVEARTGSRIGGISMAQGNSIGGLLSNIESAPATLMQRLLLARGGAEGLAGFQAFTGALRELNGVLDASTPRGMAFQGVMERLIDGVFGALFQGGDATAFVDTLLGALERLEPAVVAVATGLRSFGGGAAESFLASMQPVMALLDRTDDPGQTFQKFLRDTGTLVGYLAGALVLLTVVIGVALAGFGGFVGELGRELAMLYEKVTGIPAMLGEAWASVTAWFGGLRADAVFLGRSIAEGLGEGILAALPSPVAAIASVGEAILAANASQFDMHSPSRVMARMGGFVSQGFADGIAAGAPGAASALDGLVAGIGAPATTAGALAAAAGGGGISVGDVSVAVAVPPGVTDAEGVATAVSALLPGALAEALRQLATERGVR